MSGRQAIAVLPFYPKILFSLRVDASHYRFWHAHIECNTGDFHSTETSPNRDQSPCAVRTYARHKKTEPHHCQLHYVILAVSQTIHCVLTFVHALSRDKEWRIV